MTPGLYVDAESPIHRLHAGVKLAGLVVAATAVFLTGQWGHLLIALTATGLLYPVARIPRRLAGAQVRPLLPLLAVIFVFQALFDHWTTGLIVVTRFLILILLASLLTLTTRVSEMIEVIERALRPLERFGANPAKISLAISLCLRFLPLIAQKFDEVREAQNARGLGGSVAATAVPLIVRTLRMADDVAEALEARSYDPDMKHPRTAGNGHETPDSPITATPRKAQR